MNTISEEIKQFYGSLNHEADNDSQQLAELANSLPIWDDPASLCVADAAGCVRGWAHGGQRGGEVPSRARGSCGRRCPG